MWRDSLRRIPHECRHKVDAATRCSGVWPHTWPDLTFGPGDLQAPFLATRSCTGHLQHFTFDTMCVRLDSSRLLVARLNYKFHPATTTLGCTLDHRSFILHIKPWFCPLFQVEALQSIIHSSLASQLQSAHKQWHAHNPWYAHKSTLHAHLPSLWPSVWSPVILAIWR